MVALESDITADDTQTDGLLQSAGRKKRPTKKGNKKKRPTKKGNKKKRPTKKNKTKKSKRGSSPWILHVKSYAKKHNIKFPQALREAGKSFKKQDS